MNDDMGSNKPYLVRAIFDWIVDNDCTPYLVASSEVPGLDVPGEFLKDGQITLNISPVAVPDLLMDNHCVTFSARFSGVARRIFVPMDSVVAVFAQENGQGMMFEITQSIESKSQASTSPKKPGLKVVK